MDGNLFHVKLKFKKHESDTRSDSVDLTRRSDISDLGGRQTGQSSETTAHMGAHGTHMETQRHVRRLCGPLGPIEHVKAGAVEDRLEGKGQPARGRSQGEGGEKGKVSCSHSNHVSASLIIRIVNFKLRQSNCTLDHSFPDVIITWPMMQLGGRMHGN